MWRVWLSSGYSIGFTAVLVPTLWWSTAVPQPLAWGVLIPVAFLLTAVLNLLALEAFFDPKSIPVSNASAAGRGRIGELTRGGFLFGSGGATVTAAAVWMAGQLSDRIHGVWPALLVPMFAGLAAITWAVNEHDDRLPP